MTDAALGSSDERIRVLDGASGGTVATPVESALIARPLALTDLDGDSVPDLLAWINNGFPQELRAYRGGDWQLLWRQDLAGGEQPAKALRTRDTDDRLAVLFDNGKLAYLDPDTGVELRSAMLRPAAGGSNCGQLCSISYFSHGPRSGAFVYTVLDRFVSALDRSLRGAASSADVSEFGTRGLTVVGGHLQVGSDEPVLRALELPQEGLFADSLEGW